MAIGPNGPVGLNATGYDYDDLRARLAAALALDEAFRDAALLEALSSAKLFASGAGADEAPLFPAPVVARSSYALADAGIIQRKPGTMSGYGPYWTSLLSVATDPFWGPLGVKWLLYYSTDHASGDGGIYLSVSLNADPKVAASWQTYNQALAAGVFASVAVKPAANPIYIHGANLSTETPQVAKIGDVWVLTYQTYKLANSENQATSRRLSADGLNWDGTLTAPLLQITGSGAMGDGHTGYFRWGPNPFNRSIVPYPYVGYSLAGGTDKALFAQWGTDDPVNGAWTQIQTISPQYGRLGAASFGPTGGDIAQARQTRQGVAILNGRSSGGSGVENQYGTLAEALLDETGTVVSAQPIDLLALPLNADVQSQASVPSVVTRQNERVVAYQGSRDPDANTHINVTAIATSPRRNALNTYFDALVPAAPVTTTREVDFRTASAFPGWMTIFNNGPATTMVFDPAVGLNINIPSGGTTRNLAYYFEEIAGANFIDLYVWDWRSRGAGAYRTMAFGLSVAAAGAAVPAVNNNDGLFVRNGGAGNIGVKGSKVGGVETTTALERYPTLSWQNTSKPNGRKNIGMRWFRSAGKAYLLGEGAKAGGVETEEILVPADLKPGGSLYGLPVRPWFGMVNILNNANNEQILATRARWG